MFFCRSSVHSCTFFISILFEPIFWLIRFRSLSQSQQCNQCPVIVPQAAHQPASILPWSVSSHIAIAYANGSPHAAPLSRLGTGKLCCSHDWQMEVIAWNSGNTKLLPFHFCDRWLPTSAQILPGLTRHDSTRSTCRAHAFWLCRLCRTARLDMTSSTGSTRRSWLAWFARHDKSDRHDSQLSLLCNFYKVMITVIHVLFNVSYSLIYWFYI